MGIAVRAQKVYVDTVTGSALGDGSAESPYDDVADAITAVEAQTRPKEIHVYAPVGTPQTTAMSMAPSFNYGIFARDGGFWYSTATIKVEGGTAAVTLSGAHVTVSGDDAIRVGKVGEPAGTSNLYAFNCYAKATAPGENSAYKSIDRFTLADFTNCEADSCSNDGFSVNGSGSMYLRNCNSHDNAQEGATPHDTSQLFIIGGTYTGNGESGMHAINTSRCDISGDAVFDSNGFSSEDPVTVGNAGAKWRDAAYGEVDGASFTNNNGSGIYYSGTGSLTLTSYTSTGNGDADVLP